MSSAAKKSYVFDCKKCNNQLTRKDALTDNVCMADDALYHAKHFKCERCKTDLASRSFFKTSGNEPLCVDCYMTENNPKCHVCRKAALETFLKELGSYYHRDCFKCHFCHNPIKDDVYVLHNDAVYDEDCFYLETKLRLKPDRLFEKKTGPDHIG
ncbi:hypothetical protein WR25_07421 [Diploscapter pachys]|uniref:LIM zinc-binding domain-containing protein n=1 Tax=Diploscapter pachys TaxID=2018661 RepID=A0A2A2KXL2_9BILA|nr:hypothetical protein WR25_07421 [Diploscapter pachys]